MPHDHAIRSALILALSNLRFGFAQPALDRGIAAGLLAGAIRGLHAHVAMVGSLVATAERTHDQLLTRLHAAEGAAATVAG
jgi:hypothetical protein